MILQERKYCKLKSTLTPRVIDGHFRVEETVPADSKEAKEFLETQKTNPVGPVGSVGSVGAVPPDVIPQTETATQRYIVMGTK